MINRRNFIAQGWGALLIALSAWRPLKAAAETDYFTGTEYVGKTRAGRYRDFYINYWKTMRRIDAERWTLQVGGLCENPGSFRLDDLRALPQKTQTSRLKCVECWSAKAQWTGFHFSELERRVQPLPNATGAVFHCGDEYREFADLVSLRHARSLFAYEMDGQPLTDGHGFPLRLVVPFKYGYKNPKAILKVEFVEESQPGTWSRIGPYSTDGTILPGYDHPLDRGKIRRRIFGGEIKD